MNCSRLETLLTDYLDQTLDPRVHGAATEHLRTCSACWNLLEEVRALRIELSDVPELTPPEGLVDRILEATSGKPKNRSLWSDMILPTVVPFFTQRFAFATLMMFVFLMFMVNMIGPGFSAFSYNSLRPSALIEEADRVSNQIYTKWMQVKDVKTRAIAEARLLKEDVYGRLDYYLVTFMFGSHSEPVSEQDNQQKQEAKE
jgi:hypothetical protein